jgi:hypothetical protein
METVREQLVKRPAKQSDIFVKYGAWAVAAIIITAAIFTLVPLGEIFIVAAALLTMLVLWGAYYVSGLANVEYEYCIAGAEFSVDKIVNQSKRKTLCSFNLKSAAGFYKTKKELSDATVISAESYGEVYTIEYSDPKYGRTLVYFSPDERTLEMITPYLPRLS